MGDTCPICGHMSDTGAHSLETSPAHPLPVLLCPSFEEFVLDATVVMFDQDAAPNPTPE